MAKVELKSNKVKKKSDKKLVINHMYSDSLNIYGDLGNILALKYRAEKRGIEVKIVHTELGEEFKKADIYFIGGGQDLDQIRVYEDLLKHKEEIKKEVEKGKIFLLICGGYQLFGKFFVDGNGNVIKGLDILDIETKALDASVLSRCIGNIVAEITPEFAAQFEINTKFSKYILGFENHGGQTKLLSDEIKPIGNVVSGFGNNSFDKLEGCFYKNIIGSYCHGSLLPKNPHLTDALIKKAMIKKYKEFNLKGLNSEVEKNAHEAVLDRIEELN